MLFYHNMPGALTFKDRRKCLSLLKHGVHVSLQHTHFVVVSRFRQAGGRPPARVRAELLSSSQQIQMPTSSRHTQKPCIPRQLGTWSASTEGESNPECIQASVLLHPVRELLVPASALEVSLRGNSETCHLPFIQICCQYFYQSNAIVETMF